MEAKTIGKFIAALRKANGMTQKDLAEKLNVSDKSISRWERDEGAPDLSLIPIIAEIFGVTCDELLRGERRSPKEREKAACAEKMAYTGKEECAEEFDDVTSATCKQEMTTKGEKQLKRLLKSTLSKYQTRTYISMGISVVGIIVALICNIAFLRASLGFLLGAVFFVVAIVCQAVFVNRAFLSVEDAELEEESMSEFKRSVIGLAEKSIGLTVAFVGFTFPLVLVDAYMGLGTDSLFLFGGIGAAAFLLVYVIVLFFVNAAHIKNGVYSLKEQEAVVYYHNHGLKSRLAAVLILVALVTFFVHQVMTTLSGPGSIVQGTTFNDYDSFIAYMEQDIPYHPRSEFYGGTTAPESAVAEQIGETTYYDEFGNVITEEEARHRILKDKNGNVVCEYIDRNETVASMSYSPQDGTVLPITVRTYEDLEEAKAIVRMRHVIFGLIYAAEVLGVVLTYFIRRKK